MAKNMKTAIVADDDPDIRTVVSGLLEGAGWSVVTVEDGEKAVFAAIGQAPDLIILDVMMPGGDGLDALRALRDDVRTEHIPVVMLTAANDYALGHRQTPESVAASLGVRAPEHFMEKPVEGDKLLRVINALFEA